MKYYTILNLEKEPFSNSPDPDFFFQSRQHLACIQKLEISLRLQRGLSVVIGDVGTGKTTLCRELIRKFALDEACETHLILDPGFKTPLDSLAAISELFKISLESDERLIKENIKKYLFTKGVDEKKNIIIIIDEGQKISGFFIEILRELLNYETNQYKLLQIVIFAQKEFENTLKQHDNFADRISLYHFLKPLDFYDMKKMIQFRLGKSVHTGTSPAFFTYPALWAVYKSTKGYPRQIINLCHQSLLMMIIQNRSRAGWGLVRTCAKREIFRTLPDEYKSTIIKNILFIFTILVLVLFIKFHYNDISYIVDKVFYSKIFITSETKEQYDLKDISLTKQIPATLGRVAVAQRETLGELIKKVYGTVNPELLQKVLDANEHITSPDRISIGQLISFPAIPVNNNDKLTDLYFLQVGKKNNIQSAFKQLRFYEKNNEIKMRIIPYWNNHEQLKFLIITDEYFFDEKSIQNKIRLLQPLFVSKLNILKLWNKDTIFFANLFN